MEKLIYDRTLQDVQNKTVKGYYNRSNIIRINSYIRYISEALNLGLTVVDPVLGEPVTDYLTSAINNINTIRAVWYVAEDTPNTPTPFAWNYSKANDIEKIIQAFYDFIISVDNDKLYSGTFRAGSHIKIR